MSAEALFIATLALVLIGLLVAYFDEKRRKRKKRDKDNNDRDADEVKDALDEMDSRSHRRKRRDDDHDKEPHKEADPEVANDGPDADWD